MRILRLASVLGMLVALFIYLLPGAGAEEARGYTVITTADLKKMQGGRESILVVDTLPESAYRQGHIPGAKHFEFPNGNMDRWNKSKTAGRSKDDFVALLGQDKKKPLVFYCLDEK